MIYVYSNFNSLGSCLGSKILRKKNTKTSEHFWESDYSSNVRIWFGLEMICYGRVSGGRGQLGMNLSQFQGQWQKIYPI